MKTKFTFMLIGALVLGILIGVLATGRYTRHKVVQIKELGTPEGMHKRFYNLIDPSEDQDEEIRPILREYAAQSQEMRQRHWDEHKELFKQVQEKLEPLLDEEQLERLENFKNRSPMQGQMRRDSYRKHMKGCYDASDDEAPRERRYRNRGK